MLSRAGTSETACGMWNRICLKQERRLLKFPVSYANNRFAIHPQEDVGTRVLHTIKLDLEMILGGCKVHISNQEKKLFTIPVDGTTFRIWISNRSEILSAKLLSTFGLGFHLIKVKFNGELGIPND